MENISQNDEVWCFNAAVPEEFHVEELLNLDFSDDGGFFEEDKALKLNKKYGVSNNGSSSNNNNSSTTFSGADEFDSLSTGGLTDPAEGLESLEWLSQFAEDSTAELSLLCPRRSFMVEDSGGIPPVKIQGTFLPVSVPRKRRSERRRASGLPWSFVSPALNSVDSSSPTSSSHGSFTLTAFAFQNPGHGPDWFSSTESENSPEPPQKKQKRKTESESSGRRCTHCLVQKTPQWRTGPLGPKTLCNACGVRFKSGRLFPEYRPACSPTFSQEVHSNSHRKVLEMRRKKEMTAAKTGLDEGGGFSSPVVEIRVSN